MKRSRFWPFCCMRARAQRPSAAGAALTLLLAASVLVADEPVATFSIVGYDPETGDLGVAVQSKFFAVGSAVPFARAGVGAIATQAQGNMSFGPRGLALLELGAAPDVTLDTMLSDDPDSAHRQVGIVNAKGVAVSYTGTECMEWAGGRVGENFAAQGNILVSAETVDAMAEAFENTDGMLGERLMRALEAGQAAGGDSRGVQSAAMVVVREGGGYGGLSDRYCDLRVDDSEDPIGELRRLFDIWKHEALILEGYRLSDAKEWDKAFEAGRQAIALSPFEGEPHYHLACFYAKAGMYEEALGEIEKAYELDGSLPSWAAEDPDLEPIRESSRMKKLLRE